MVAAHALSLGLVLITNDQAFRFVGGAQDEGLDRSLIEKSGTPAKPRRDVRKALPVRRKARDETVVASGKSKSDNLLRGSRRNNHVVNVNSRLFPVYCHSRLRRLRTNYSNQP